MGLFYSCGTWCRVVVLNSGLSGIRYHPALKLFNDSKESSHTWCNGLDTVYVSSKPSYVESVAIVRNDEEGSLIQLVPYRGTFGKWLCLDKDIRPELPWLDTGGFISRGERQTDLLTPWLGPWDVLLCFGTLPWRKPSPVEAPRLWPSLELN